MLRIENPTLLIKVACRMDQTRFLICVLQMRKLKFREVIKKLKRGKRG